jgi:hypothetical protein
MFEIKQSLLIWIWKFHFFFSHFNGYGHYILDETVFSQIPCFGRYVEVYFMVGILNNHWFYKLLQSTQVFGLSRTFFLQNRTRVSRRSKHPLSTGHMSQVSWSWMRLELSALKVSVPRKFVTVNYVIMTAIELAKRWHQTWL